MFGGRGGGATGHTGTSNVAEYIRVYHRTIDLRTELNSPLAYAPGFYHHHPNMSTLGEYGGQVDI